MLGAKLHSTCDAKKNALQRHMDRIEGDIDGAKQEAEDWEFNSYISTGINDVEQVSHSKDVNSFDVVALMKRKLDTKDPYLIYHMSNGAMNNSSYYVFKSSQKAAEVNGCRCRSTKCMADTKCILQCHSYKSI